MRFDLQYGVTGVGGDDGLLRALAQHYIAEIDDALGVQLDFGGDAIAVEQDVERFHAFFPETVQMQIARDRAAPRGAEGNTQRQGAQAIGRQQEFILRVYLRIEGEIVAGRADLVDIEVGVADVGDFDDLAAVFADGDLAKVHGLGAEFEELTDTLQP